MILKSSWRSAKSVVLVLSRPSSGTHHSNKCKTILVHTYLIHLIDWSQSLLYSENVILISVTQSVINNFFFKNLEAWPYINTTTLPPSNVKDALTFMHLSGKPSWNNVILASWKISMRKNITEVYNMISSIHSLISQNGQLLQKKISTFSDFRQ